MTTEAIKCVHCEADAVLVVENSLTAGLEGVCTLCVSCATAWLESIGDFAGVKAISEKYKVAA